MTPRHLQKQNSPEASLDVNKPSTLPLEARRAIDQTMAGTDAMFDAQRELHFEVNEKTGTVEIELRDLDGNILRRIPPGEALDLLAGAGGWSS